MSIMADSIPEPVSETVTIYSCPDCGLRFMDLESYQKHYRNCAISKAEGKLVRFTNENGTTFIGRIESGNPGTDVVDPYDGTYYHEEPELTILSACEDAYGTGFEIGYEEVHPDCVEEITREEAEDAFRHACGVILENVIAEVLDGRRRCQ